MKEPTQLAIDAAEKIGYEAYEAYFANYEGSSFSNSIASTIIQAAIDEAVRESLDKAAERASDWLVNSTGYDGMKLRSAILVEDA